MSTATVTPIAGEAPAFNQIESNILERAVCITIEFGTLGNSKKVSMSMIEVPLKPTAAEPAAGISEDASGNISLNFDYATCPGCSGTILLTGVTDPQPIVIGKTGRQYCSESCRFACDDVPSSEPGAVVSDAVPVELSEKNGPAVDKTMLRASKKLIDSPELSAIRKHDGRIRAYVYGKCLPYKIGIHLLPHELVKQVEEDLKRFADEREILVGRFLEAYNQQVQDAGGRLLVLFNQDDYKNVDQVKKSFHFDWQYLSFGTPGKLRDISPELFAAEQEKAARKWQEASEAIHQVMRVQMQELVDKIHGKLAPNDDGKAKGFRKENIENLRTFIEDFDIRNIANDSDLKALVERARALLGNVDVESIKSDEKLREELAAGFGKIKEELKDIIVDGGERAISFED